jgi:uncharacterized protein with HEPN domain
MDSSDRELLADMLAYAEAAIRLLGSADAGALKEDERTFFAVSYALQIVGEAATQLSAATRSELADVPWPDVIGMRHRLVHAYERIRPEVVVSTVREDLPELITTLRRALEGQ